LTRVPGLDTGSVTRSNLRGISDGCRSSPTGSRTSPRSRTTTTADGLPSSAPME
jgi:hypothetical protein